MSSPLLNVPRRELDRTPVGARIGALAAASELFLYHTEHRVHLPLPEHWLPEGRGELGLPAAWQAGILRESRLRLFRLDAMVGGFHPAQTGPWAVHELCHRLVGFAWRPHPPPLFLVLGARLSEVLPTAVHHFFEEAWLPRCPAHAGQGSMVGVRCPACEARRALDAAGPPDELERGHLSALGRRFVDAELAAIARSRRTGRCEPNGCGGLDLAGDALAYTQAHLERLQSPEMAELVEKGFAGTDCGRHASLDALEARVVAVRDALLTGDPLPAWPATAERWASQDLAWRLLTVRAECEPADGAAAGLRALVDALLDGAPAARAYEGYRALHDEFVLPDPADVFAVGYDLPGAPGRSVRQITEGLETVVPGTMALLDSEAETAAVVAEFLGADAAVRVPLARRFAAFLRAHRPGPVADLATYEAAIAHPLPPDPEAATLGVGGARDKRRRRSRSFEILRFGCDVLALAQALDADPGDPVADEESAAELVHRPTCLAIGRPVEGELVITDITGRTADALERLGTTAAEPATVGLAKGEAAALEAVGVLVPAAWKSE